MQTNDFTFDTPDDARLERVNSRGDWLIKGIILMGALSSGSLVWQTFAAKHIAARLLLTVLYIAVVDLALLWLVDGFTNAYSTDKQRKAALFGIVFFGAVALTNIVTHFMEFAGSPLSIYQREWLRWGLIAVVGVTFGVALYLKLNSPKIAQMRLERQYSALRDSVTVQAKTRALGSQVVQEAISQIEQIEAQAMAARLIEEARQRHPGLKAAPTQSRPAAAPLWVAPPPKQGNGLDWPEEQIPKV
ncbi:MAG: hypothetical protein HOP19_21540 [Acidobacteria bacterium]|nr:hypothetical protein [Acidobacteriota bacterium]